MRLKSNSGKVNLRPGDEVSLHFVGNRRTYVKFYRGSDEMCPEDHPHGLKFELSKVDEIEDLLHLLAWAAHLDVVRIHDKQNCWRYSFKAL